MEEKNKIDEIFKTSLDNLEMEPSAKSWDNVSSKLAAKRAVRKKRRAGLWFSATALLLLLSYTSFRLLNKVSPEDNEKIQKSEQSEPVANSTPSAPSTLQPQDNSTLTASTESTPPVAPNEPAPSVSETNNSTPSQTSVQSPVSKPLANTGTNTNSSTVPTQKEEVNPSTSGNYVAPVAAGTAASQGIAGATSANSTSLNSPANETQSSQAQQSNAQTSPSQETTNNIEPESVSNTTTTDNSAPPSQSNPAESTPKSGNDNSLIAPAVIGGTAAVAGNSASTPSPQSSGPDNSSPAQPESLTTPTASVDSTPAVNPKSSSSLINRIVSHLGLEVYYTPEYAQTNMEVNEDYFGPASQDLDDYKNETSQYSYSAGINLSYSIGKHWSILSGYSISDYSKSAVYNTVSVVVDSVFQYHYIQNPGGHQGGSGGHHNNHHGGGGGGGHHGGGGGGGGGHHGGGGQGGHGHQNPGNPNDPNSNCHYVINTACGTIDLNNVPSQAANASNGDTLKIKVETLQSIHFYSIPLLVRYSFGMKKISYFVEAGGAINYVTTDQVKVIVNDATVEDNSLDAIRNMNYTLLFGVGAKYNFFKKVNFFLKPSLRYSITPINVDSPVKSYPYYIGIGGGLSIDF